MSVRIPPIFTTSTSPGVWIDRFTCYATASAIAETLTLNALKALLDDATFYKFNEVQFVGDEYKSMAKIREKFIACFTPITLEGQLRFEFTQRMQKKNETFELFAEEIQKLAQAAYKSHSSNVTAELCRDQFIQGINEPFIKELLLRESPQTLDEALRTAKTALLARGARTDIMDSNCVLRVHDDPVNKENPTVQSLAGEIVGIKQQIATMQHKQDEFLNKLNYGTLISPQAPYGQQNTSQYYTNNGNNCAYGYTNANNQPPRQLMAQNSRMIQNDTRSCYKCGQQGHIAKNCQTQHLNFNGRRN